MSRSKDEAQGRGGVGKGEQSAPDDGKRILAVTRKGSGSSNVCRWTRRSCWLFALPLIASSLRASRLPIKALPYTGTKADFVPNSSLTLTCNQSSGAHLTDSSPAKWTCRTIFEQTLSLINGQHLRIPPLMHEILSDPLVRQIAHICMPPACCDNS